MIQFVLINVVFLVFLANMQSNIDKPEAKVQSKSQIQGLGLSLKSYLKKKKKSDSKSEGRKKEIII